MYTGGQRIMDIYIKGRKEMGCVYFSSGCFDIKELKGYSDNQCDWLSLIDALYWVSGNREGIDEFNIYTDNLRLFWQMPDKYGAIKNSTKAKSLKPIRIEKWLPVSNQLRDVNIKYLHISGYANPAREVLKNETHT